MRISESASSTVITQASVSSMQCAVEKLLLRIAGKEELGKHLAHVLTHQRGSLLDRALRENRSVLVGPGPEEALATLLAHLLRNATPGGVVDFRPLALLGEEGKKALKLLSEEPAMPVSAAMLQRIRDDAFRSIPWMEGEQLKPLLSLKVKEESTFTAAPVAAVAKQSRTQQTLEWQKILPALTYGFGHLSRIIEEETTQSPPSPLAIDLAEAGSMTDSDSRFAAFLRLLWKFRKSDTELDLGAFEKKYGEPASRWASALKSACAITQPERPNYQGMARLVRALSRQGASRDETLSLVNVLVRNDSLIPPRIAALDAVKAAIPENHLQGKSLLGAQHLLPNTVPLIEAFIEKGMASKDIHIHGTPYNNNPLVTAYLELLGVHVKEGHDNLGSTFFLKEQKLQELEGFVADVAKRKHPPRGWKILDDGGLLQEVIAGNEKSVYGHSHHLDFKSVFTSENTDAVEQTTRGLTEFPNPAFPTMAVARAEGKKREGAVIGWALADSAIIEMRQRGMPPNKTRLALVGAGTIGLHTAQQLRNASVQVTAVDINPERLKPLQAEGFETATRAEDALPNVDMVLSCTGRNVWNGKMLAEWKGLMVQGASMAAEFDIDEINSFRSMDLEVGNRGRPINFHSDGHAVLHHDEIGITLALLFLGVCETPDSRLGGYRDLDNSPDSLQAKAIEAWEKHLPPPREISIKDRATPRPDAFADESATREEWFSYLSSLRRPVTPPPNSVKGHSPIYFFEDEEGQVRFVDVRVGKSLPTGLQAVPRSAYALTSESEDYFVAVSRKEGFQCLLVSVREGVPEFREKGVFDEVVAHYIADNRSLETGQGVVSMGLALRDRETLRVLMPGETEFRVVSNTAKPDSLWAWERRDTLIQVQRQPPELNFVTLRDSIFSDMFKRYRLPPEMVKIEAVSTWSRYQQMILVGRDKENRLVLAPVSSSGSHLAPAVLPHDAVYRGIRPSPEGKWGQLVVDYTLASDPAETTAYRSQGFDFIQLSAFF